MDTDAMKSRTRAFALRVIKLVDSLPPGRVSEVLGKQLLRSATSVGANYRAARRSRSRAEFVSKLGIVEEEVDESSYWLELLADSGVVRASRLDELRTECDEITAIVVATIRSTKGTRKQA